MDTLETKIRGAIKAAEKSPVAAVNQLWALLGKLDEVLGKDRADLEKRAKAAEQLAAETEKRAKAAEKLAGKLQAELNTLPPLNLANAVKGYLRALDNKRSDKQIGRCREQVDAILARE